MAQAIILYAGSYYFAFVLIWLAKKILSVCEKTTDFIKKNCKQYKSMFFVLISQIIFL